MVLPLSHHYHLLTLQGSGNGLWRSAKAHRHLLHLTAYLDLPQLDTVGELLLSLKNKSGEFERGTFWHAVFYPIKLAPVKRSDLWQGSDTGSDFNISQIAACLNSTKVRQQYQVA